MLQPKKDKTKILYDAVSEEYNLGSYEEFSTKLQDPEKRKVLYDAIGADYNLGSYEEFESKVVKKKENTTSTSTTPDQNSGSVPKDGSLDIARQEFKTSVQNSIDQAKNKKEAPFKVDPELAKTLKEDTPELKAEKERLVTDFRTATAMSDEDNNSIQQATTDEENKNKSGFWNGLIEGSRRTVNTFLPKKWEIEQTKPFEKQIKEAKKEAVQKGEKVSDDELNQRAISKFQKEEKQKIFEDKASNFLRNLSTEQKVLIESQGSKNFEKLSEKSKTLVDSNLILKDAIDDNKATLEQLATEFQEYSNRNEAPPEDLVSFYKETLQLYNNQAAQINNNLDAIFDNQDDLMSAEEELDLFKRAYGRMDNFGGNITATTVDLASGMLDFIGTYGPNNPMPGVMNTATPITDEMLETSEEIRAQLRRPIQEVKSVEGFFDYTQDLIANQLPILAATSTGYGGLAVLGASSAGQKSHEMQDEVAKGEASYNPLQMYAAPLLYGSAEVVSEIPTLSILKKGKRVLAATAKETIDKTVKQRAIDWAKDFGIDMSKEMAGEQFTNFVQNFNDKYVLGKDEVGLLDNTGDVFKDTFTLTSILKVSPHVAGSIMKGFQSKLDSKRLENNSKRIKELSDQLNIPNITATEKSVIENQIKKVALDSEQIINGTIGKMVELPKEDFEEVARIDKEKEKISKQAKEIFVEGNSPNKQEIIEDLEKEHTDLENRKNQILNGELTLFDETNTEAETTTETEQATQPETETQAQSEEVVPEETDAPLIDESTIEKPQEDEAIQTNTDQTDEGVRTNSGIDTREGQIEASRESDTGTDGENIPENRPEETTVKRVKSVKNAEYDVTFDSSGNITKITSIKDGREIPKFIESTSRKGKKYIKKNANYSKIEADATGTITDNQSNTERRAEITQSLEQFTPADEYDHALEYIARGGNINLQSAKNETGLSSNEVRWVTGMKPDSELPSVEKAAEQIVANSNRDLDLQEVRNALIEIISSKKGVNEVQNDIVEQQKELQNQQEEQELFELMNSLTEQERALFEAIQVEDDYISELTDEEAIAYFEDKIKEYEQGQAATIEQQEREAGINPSTEIDTESNPTTEEPTTEYNQEESGERESDSDGERQKDLSLKSKGKSPSISETEKRKRYEKPKKEKSKEFKLHEKLLSILHKYAPKSKVLQKHEGKGALGRFFTKTKNIALRSLTNTSVAFHELAHALDQEHGLIKNLKDKNIQKELERIYLEFYPNASESHNKRLQRIEGFAMFMQKYLENPSLIKASYPKLIDYFLDENNSFKGINSFLNEASDIISDYQKLTPIQAVGSRIIDDPLEDKKTVGEKVVKTVDRVAEEVADNISQLEALSRKDGTFYTSDDAAQTMRMANKSAIYANNNINGKNTGYWVFNEKGEWEKKYNFNWRDIFKKLNSRKKELGVSKPERIFGHFLVARRAYFDMQLLDQLVKERDSMIQNNSDQKLIDEINESIDKLSEIVSNDNFNMDDVKSTYEQYKEVFKEETKMYDTLINEHIKLLANPEVGIISKESYEKMSNRKGYASFARFQYDEITRSGMEEEFLSIKQSSGKKPSSLKSRTGSEKPILNPMLSAISAESEIIRKSMKQATLNKIGKMAPKHPEIFQEVEVKTSFNEKTKTASFPQESDPNYIVTMSNGKRKAFLISPEMSRVIEENFTYDNTHIIFKLLQSTARLFKAGTTGWWLPFLVTNIQMDQLGSTINSKTNFLPFITSSKEMFKLSISPKDSSSRKYFNEYLWLASTSQTSGGWNKQSFRKIDNKMLNKSFGSKSVRFMERVSDIITAPSNYSEIMTRATEYIRMRERGYPQRIALEQSGRVSTPFHHTGRLGGKTGRDLIRTVPYMNASIQVLAQTLRTLRTPEGQKRFAFVSAAVTVANLIPLIYALSDDDEKNEEIKQLYNSISPEEMGKAIYIKNPYENNLMAFRAPEQATYFSTLINMAILEIYNDANYSKKEWLSGTTTTIPTQMKPWEGVQWVMSIYPNFLKGSTEVALNKKTYPVVRDLENFGDRRKPTELRYDEWSSPFAKNVAKTDVAKGLGLSPKKLDHLIGSYGGRTAQFLTGKPNRWKLPETFSRTIYFHASRQMLWFYDFKKENQELKNVIESEDFDKINLSDKEIIQIMKNNDFINYMSEILKDYRNIDEAKEPKKAREFQMIIFNMIQDYREQNKTDNYN